MKTIGLATIVSLLVGCMAGSDAEAPLSYEQFKAQYVGVTTEDGVEHMFYDWDMPLASESEVGMLYEAYLAAKVGGETLSEAAVATNVHGDDIKWSADAAQNLTYCISDEFGQRKTDVVNAMAAATAAWADATNSKVKYVYKSEHDASCDTETPVEFDVKPGGAPYAKAFLPSYARNKRSVLIHADTFDGTFPAAGILRHELGHTLGLRHETTRREAVEKYGTHCFENIYHRTLTDYDDNSVMTTPACMGKDVKNKSLTLSANDVAGIRILYP